MDMKWDSEAWGGAIDIDHDKCDACVECVDSCPSECFELKDGKSHVINIDECVECCACVETCPEGAIRHTSC